MEISQPGRDRVTLCTEAFLQGIALRREIDTGEMTTDKLVRLSLVMANQRLEQLGGADNWFLFVELYSEFVVYGYYMHDWVSNELGELQMEVPDIERLIEEKALAKTGENISGTEPVEKRMRQAAELNICYSW